MPETTSNQNRRRESLVKVKGEDFYGIFYAYLERVRELKEITFASEESHFVISVPFSKRYKVR